MDDVDALGNSVDVFVRQVFTSAVDDGVTHVLIDMPSVTDVEGAFPDGSLTIEQEKILDIRPFWRHVRAADLLGWKWRVIAGKKTLTQIRILEFAKTAGEDEFTQIVKKRIRVIEPDRWRLFEEQLEDAVTKEKKWIVVEEGTNTLGKIPLVTFYTNQKGFMVATPLLTDVAYLNVAHWQSDSDQRNLLHVARVPILFATGFGDDDDQVQLEIGANSITRAPTGATLAFIEHTGTGIESGRNDLKDIEERIQFIGMQLLIKRRSGDETATGRSIDKSEGDSDLAIIAMELESSIEECLDLTAEWLTLGDSGGEVTVFKDFGIEFADSKDIELLLKAKAAGDISQMTFFKELKRRGLLSDDFNPQTEIDLLDIEGGGSAGETISDDPDSSGVQDGEGVQETPTEGRNVERDTTAESDGHRHILEANGRTDAVTDSETGETHFHTWDEFALRTSVEDGHSHILLSRAGGQQSGNSSEGQFEQGAAPAGEGGQIGGQGEGGDQPAPA
jgi:hypothetical protein